MTERKKIHSDNLVIDDAQTRQGKWEYDEADRRLVESVEGMGLIQDVIVRELDEEGKYGIVAGSRRHMAMVHAGETEIPCKVLDLTDEEALRTSLGENIGRKDLTDYEKVRAIGMWYDLLAEDLVTECPECGADDFDGADGLAGHVNSSHDDPSFTVKQGYRSERQIHKEIAGQLYGDEGKWQTVRRIVKAHHLPDRVKLLLKEDLADEDVDKLRKQGLRPGLLTTSGADGVTAAVDPLASIQDLLDAHPDTLLRIVGNCQAGTKTELKQNLTQVRRLITDWLEEGVSESDAVDYALRREPVSTEDDKAESTDETKADDEDERQSPEPTTQSIDWGGSTTTTSQEPGQKAEEELSDRESPPTRSQEPDPSPSHPDPAPVEVTIRLPGEYREKLAKTCEDMRQEPAEFLQEAMKKVLDEKHGD